MTGILSGNPTANPSGLGKPWDTELTGFLGSDDSAPSKEEHPPLSPNGPSPWRRRNPQILDSRNMVKQQHMSHG